MIECSSHTRPGSVRTKPSQAKWNREVWASYYIRDHITIGEQSCSTSVSLLVACFWRNYLWTKQKYMYILFELSLLLVEYWRQRTNPLHWWQQWDKAILNKLHLKAPTGKTFCCLQRGSRKKPRKHEVRPARKMAAQLILKEVFAAFKVAVGRSPRKTV